MTEVDAIKALVSRQSRRRGYRGEQVKAFALSYHSEHGVSPSYGIIRDRLGFNTTADVCNVVRRLERRGLVSRTGGRGRRIRLPQTGNADEAR